MLHWLRRNSELKRTAHQLYERIVAQARSESFYREMGVPDTMEGRFEMIVLHLFLVRERLKSEGEDGQRLGQIVLEKLISDMDDALRQIGYDMAVPKRVKKAVNAFAERSQAYGAALALEASSSGHDQLQSALRQHVYGDCADPDDPRQAGGIAGLAAYVRRAATTVAATRSSEVLAGEIDFPLAGPHA
jgi:cytochrome b pre-mRNA-processing protein 3